MSVQNLTESFHSLASLVEARLAKFAIEDTIILDEKEERPIEKIEVLDLETSIEKIVDSLEYIDQEDDYVKLENPYKEKDLVLGDLLKKYVPGQDGRVSSDSVKYRFPELIKDDSLIFDNDKEAI